MATNSVRLVSHPGAKEATLFVTTLSPEEIQRLIYNVSADLKLAKGELTGHKSGSGVVVTSAYNLSWEIWLVIANSISSQLGRPVQAATQ